VILKRIPISRINPAPYNPRKDLAPGDPQYAKLKRSLDEFGCVEPLVLNSRTGNLVGGHQRLKILMERGDTHAVVSVVDLDEVREKALNLALNKIGGEWDDDMLAELLRELTSTPDFDLETTGFEVGEARDLVADLLSQGRGESFDVNAALQEAGPRVTKPGDLIVLGDPATGHRLLCGDCTEAPAVSRLMKGTKAALMATDPPYLVGYTGTNHPVTGRRPPTTKLPGNKDWTGTYGADWDDGDANPELYSKFLQAAVAGAIQTDAALYIWHASRRQAMLEQAMVAAGMLVHCQIVWVKNRPVLTRGWYAWQHEPCLMGWLKGNKPKRADRTVLSTVWEIDTLPNGPERPNHPTPKPLEVFEIPLRQHTHAGEVCYEPFAGSGTQIIAAHKLGRRCFAMEVSPVYCDLIVRRFIAFAGPEAVSKDIARRYRTGEVAA
jgi:DNA modification methylase